MAVDDEGYLHVWYGDGYHAVIFYAVDFAETLNQELRHAWIGTCPD